MNLLGLDTKIFNRLVVYKSSCALKLRFGREAVVGYLQANSSNKQAWRCYAFDLARAGETKALYCSKHKLEGMVNVTHKRCEQEGCMKSASFNIPTSKYRRFCSRHKLPGMIYVRGSQAKKKKKKKKATVDAK